MQTHGGKVSFIELSYQETGSQANNFTVSKLLEFFLYNNFASCNAL